MTVKRRVYYYKVLASSYSTAGQPHPESIQDILDSIRSKRIIPGHPQTSAMNIGGKQISVRVSGPVNGIYTGEMYTINDARAFRAILDRSGIDAIADLRIPIGHHVVDITHFVYFVARKVIGIEFNHRAARHRYFGQYFQEYARVNSIRVDEVDLSLLINRDSADRLRRLGVITSLRFTINTTQAQNIQRAGRLTQMIRAQNEIVDGDYALSIQLKRSSKARGAAVPVNKDDIVSLWSEAAELLEGLTVEAERPGGSGIERVNFVRDAFIGEFNLPGSNNTVNASDIHARTIDYFSNSVENIIWP